MMLLAFAAPYLLWLELWYVFYPLAVILLFIGVVSLPTDSSQRYKDGVPLISLLCNVAMFVAITYHFNVSIETGWGVKVVSALAAIYLLFGVMWSFEKWRRLVGASKDLIQVSILKWCYDNKLDWPAIKAGKYEDEHQVKFYKWLYYDSSIRRYKAFPPLAYGPDKDGDAKRESYTGTWEDLRDCLIPRVSDHKAQVIMWLVCWPMSVIKWLLADMVTDVVNLIFNSLRRQFQGVADRSFSEL